MNIFAVDSHPRLSAQQLPDKHICKMSLEMCQMVSIIYSSWYHNWGEVYKADGAPYDTAKGAFRNHPCTIWLSESNENLAWGLAHGLALTSEYTHRYGKIHSCAKTLFNAKKLFHQKVGKPITIHTMVNSFSRTMPDELKYDKSIDDIIAYRKYLNTKEWVKDNYVRVPERKPEWIYST
jgi:hypothetical protein